MNELCVRLEGVRKRYPHFLLDHISLELPEGSILGFIGANGAGKSTTIRILMGLVRQDSGSVARARSRACPPSRPRRSWTSASSRKTCASTARPPSPGT